MADIFDRVSSSGDIFDRVSTKTDIFDAVAKKGFIASASFGETEAHEQLASEWDKQPTFAPPTPFDESKVDWQAMQSMGEAYTAPENWTPDDTPKPQMTATDYLLGKETPSGPDVTEQPPQWRTPKEFFTEHLPASAIRTGAGIVQMPAQIAGQVTEPLARAVETGIEQGPMETAKAAWELPLDTMKAVSGVGTDFARFVGTALGAYPKQGQKWDEAVAEAWSNDPVGSAVAVFPLIKGGQVSLSGIKRIVKDATNLKPLEGMLEKGAPEFTRTNPFTELRKTEAELAKTDVFDKVADTVKPVEEVKPKASSVETTIDEIVNADISFSDKTKALKNMHKRGEITTAELGKAIMSIPADNIKAVKETPSSKVGSLLEKYDDGKLEISDIADSLRQSTDDPLITDAISNYDKAIREDLDRFGGRSGLENEAADTLLSILREKEKTASSPAAPTTGEPTITPERATGLRKSITEPEREARGLDPVEREVIKIEPGFLEGKRRIEAGEVDPAELTQSLIDNPRAITTPEAGILAADRMRLENESYKILETIDKAVQDGDITAETMARDKLDQIRKAQDKNDRAVKYSGTQGSASLRAMQIIVDQQYNLANMKLIERIKGKGAIDPKWEAEIEQIAKNIKEAKDELSKSLDKADELRALKEVEVAVKKMKADAAEEVRQAKRTRTKRELQSTREDLYKELNKTLGGQLNVGIDPAAAIIMGKLAKSYVHEGIINAASIVDHIYTATKKMGLELSKREIRDAISGYGAVPKKATKNELTAQLNSLKKEMRQMSKTEDIQSGKIAPDATAQKSAKTRMENKIKDLERRIKEGDFSNVEKKKTDLNPENLKLKWEVEKLIQDYHQRSLAHERSNYTKTQMAKDRAIAIMDLSRALKTSFDLSAVLRQGGLLHMGDPRLLNNSVKAMFKALGSEKGEFAVNEAIRQMPNYKYMQQAGMYLAEHGENISKGKVEEAYMGRYSNKPIRIGDKNINPVSASQRAYSANLNMLRAEKFNYMYDKLVGKTGKATPEQLKAIGTFINEFTGRGTANRYASALVGLNTVFFAPRYVLSRFQVLLGHPLWNKNARQSPVVQRMIAAEYAKTLTGIMTIIGLGMSMGFKVEFDPRSSDFMKMKMGNTRLDPMAGLSQTAVLLSRTITGGRKNSKGRIDPLRSFWVTGINNPKVGYGKDNWADIMMNFGRSKFSPIVGTTFDILSGENVVGGKVTPKDIPESLLLPLSFNDVYDIMKEEGVPAGSAMAILGLFGMGLQNYKPGSKDSQFYTSRTKW